jgi:hypothetical protein
MNKPYIDKKTNDESYERLFKHDVNDDEMVWHRDHESREIEILEGVGWMLQCDNQLPFELRIGDKLCIPKMEYHRIYRIGSSDLKIKICE